MSALGVSRRLAHLQGPGGRFLFVALDHGLPAGPLRGLEDSRALLRGLRGGGATGVIVNPGMVRHLAAELAGTALVVHLSAGTVLGAHPTSKILSTTVERAVGLGADAVSVQIHFGDGAEDRMLSDAGQVADLAAGYGVPTVIMAAPPPDRTRDEEACAHAVRAAAELRARVVQTPFPGSATAVRAAVRSCPVPVVIAGGPAAASAEAWLASMRDCLFAGVAGLSVGRNLFQHPDPASFLRQLHDAVFAAPPILTAAGG